MTTSHLKNLICMKNTSRMKMGLDNQQYIVQQLNQQLTHPISMEITQGDSAVSRELNGKGIRNEQDFENLICIEIFSGSGGSRLLFENLE